MSGWRRWLLCRLLARHKFGCWMIRGYGIAWCLRCQHQYMTEEPSWTSPLTTAAVLGPAGLLAAGWAWGMGWW